MYKLLVLLAVIGCTLGAVLPEGMERQPSGRIIGGKPTSINNYPYTVSVQRYGAHSCGGVVYSYNIILTAAHCLQAITSDDLRIRGGSTFWNSGGTLFTVERFLNHEDYNPSTMENDIAVLRLVGSLQLGSTMRIIKLATSTPTGFEGGVVTGWGSKYYNGPFQPELLYAKVLIIKSPLCSLASYGYGNKIKNTMLCARDDGLDTCQGDSGGPLVVANQLVGIASWGIDCGKIDFPGVYTNVVFYRNWISKSIDNHLLPSK